MRGVRGAGEPGTICAAHAETETEEVVADRRRVVVVVPVAGLGENGTFVVVCVCVWWASKLSAGGCERNA